MSNEPYATQEESQSVMSKLPKARKDAINHVNDLLDGRDLMEQGVTAEAYTKGLFEVAADLAENISAMLDSLRVMTELCAIKYGNLDTDVYAEIEKSRSIITKALAINQ